MKGYQSHITYLPPVERMLVDGLSALEVHGKVICGWILQQAIRQHTPRKSGYMWLRCKVLGARIVRGGRIKVLVGWLRGDFPRGKFYPLFVGEGTGIHGSQKRRIVAKKKIGRKVVQTPTLRYQYRGGWVTVSSTQGIKPRKMLEKGYRTARPQLLRALSMTATMAMRARVTTRGARIISAGAK